MIRKINFTIVDSLRGIAALYVTVHHCRGFLFAGLTDFMSKCHPMHFYDYIFIFLCSLTKCGPEFVILFFIVSGFSIAFSMDRQPNIFQFYFRRFVRIYPPYVTALSFAAIVFIITFHFNYYFYEGSSTNLLYMRLYNSRDFLSMKSIVLSLIYLPQGAFTVQFWSLTYEIIFYLLVPFYLLNKSAYYLLSALGYGIGWILSGYYFNNNGIIVNYLVHFNFYFMIGVFIFHHYNLVKKCFFIRKRIQLSIIICLLFLAMLMVHSKIGYSSKISTVIAIVFSILLLINFLEQSIKINIFMFIGKFSYTLYITHIASIYLLISILYNYTDIRVPVYNRYLWLGGIPFCLLFAYSLYLIAEKNTKSVLDKLRGDTR